MKALIAAVLLAVSSSAFACGVCVDDKIASCYDHAVVMSAKAKGHAVAFFAIQGELIANAETRGAIMKAIDTLPGVQRGTGRVSLENAALSFAYDPARASPESARRELGRSLEGRRLRVAPLRTIAPGS
jgi:hypothetical protein